MLGVLWRLIVGSPRCLALRLRTLGSQQCTLALRVGRSSRCVQWETLARAAGAKSACESGILQVSTLGRVRDLAAHAVAPTEGWILAAPSRRLG